MSVGIEGAEADSDSYNPSLSSDGRYVAFESNADNLVPDDTNGGTDVFVFDRQTGITERVSVSSDGAQANQQSSYSNITPDGRYISFYSYATNLVEGDTNSRVDIFVRDRQSNTTERVSLNTDGNQVVDRDSFDPSISSDGRYITFRSASDEFVSGDTNNAQDIFVRDRQAGTTERVSVSSSGVEGANDSSDGSISADGRFVVYRSDASNLVGGDTNGTTDIFLFDRNTHTTILVSVSGTGIVGNYPSYSGSISPDGSTVVFNSQSSNLISDPGFDKSNIYIAENPFYSASPTPTPTPTPSPTPSPTPFPTHRSSSSGGGSVRRIIPVVGPHPSSLPLPQAPVPTSPIPQFTKALILGMTDPSVKNLQIFLNTHGFPLAKTGLGSPGKETNFFGALTKLAVIRFQEAHAKEILVPQGLIKGTGFFGIGTRTLVNAILKN